MRARLCAVDDESWLQKQATTALFPMDSSELISDGLLDTGDLSSTIQEADLRQVRL